MRQHHPHCTSTCLLGRATSMSAMMNDTIAIAAAPLAISCGSNFSGVSATEWWYLSTRTSKEDINPSPKRTEIQVHAPRLPFHVIFVPFEVDLRCVSYQKYFSSWVKSSNAVVPYNWNTQVCANVKEKVMFLNVRADVDWFLHTNTNVE